MRERKKILLVAIFKMETQSCFTVFFVLLSLLGGGKGDTNYSRTEIKKYQSTVSQIGQDCFEKGECLNSLFVDEIETDGAQAKAIENEI